MGNPSFGLVPRHDEFFRFDPSAAASFVLVLILEKRNLTQRRQGAEAQGDCEFRFLRLRLCASALNSRLARRT